MAIAHPEDAEAFLNHQRGEITLHLHPLELPAAAASEASSLLHGHGAGSVALLQQAAPCIKVDTYLPTHPPQSAACSVQQQHHMDGPSYPSPQKLQHDTPTPPPLIPAPAARSQAFYSLKNVTSYPDVENTWSMQNCFGQSLLDSTPSSQCSGFPKSVATPLLDVLQPPPLIPAPPPLVAAVPKQQQQSSSFLDHLPLPDILTNQHPPLRTKFEPPPSPHLSVASDGSYTEQHEAQVLWGASANGLLSAPPTNFPHPVLPFSAVPPNERDPIQTPHYVPLAAGETMAADVQDGSNNLKLPRTAACTCPNCVMGVNSGEAKQRHICHHPDCKIDYEKVTHLRAHFMRCHCVTGERPFICLWPSCKMRFVCYTELRRHRQSHIEKKFICHMCGKRFARSDHLSYHIITHEYDHLRTYMRTQLKVNSDTDEGSSEVGLTIEEMLRRFDE